MRGGTFICDCCGQEYYTKNPVLIDQKHHFCSHSCKGAFLRREADKTRFKQIDDYSQQLEKWRKPIKIVVQRCYKYSINDDDLEDFKQICRICLWKLLSTNKPQKIGYFMKSFEIAIMEYCREQGKHSQNYLYEDPIFFANPEGIAEQREIIRKVVDEEKFKLLLAWALSDKTEKEMAEQLKMSKGTFSYKIWEQRKILEQCLQQ